MAERGKAASGAQGTIPDFAIRENGILDDALIGALGAALTPVSMLAGAGARMRERVLANAAEPHTLTLLADEGAWLPLFAGIRVKTLRLDRQMGVQTTLWQLDPGSRVPPHSHNHDEECLVVSGYVIHDGLRYASGDFLFAATGVRHSDFLAPEGAVLLIRGELIPDAAVLARLAAQP